MQHVGFLIGLEARDGSADAGLVAGRDDGGQARIPKYGGEHTQEGHLRGEVEMTTLLSPISSPVVGIGLIEGLERAEHNAIFIGIVAADINKIVGKLLVVFRFQIVLSGRGVACHTTAVGHVVRGGVGEGFEDGIGTFLPDFEHDFALCRITVPMIDVECGILESFHLGPKPFARPHVVGRTIAIEGVIASANVVAEDVIVQPSG